MNLKRAKIRKGEILLRMFLCPNFVALTLRCKLLLQVFKILCRNFIRFLNLKHIQTDFTAENVKDSESIFV